MFIYFPEDPQVSPSSFECMHLHALITCLNNSKENSAFLLTFFYYVPGILPNLSETDLLTLNGSYDCITHSLECRVSEPTPTGEPLRDLSNPFLKGIFTGSRILQRYKRISCLVPVAWMLAEDTRLLGQRQKIYCSQHSRQHEHHVYVSSSSPQIPPGNTEGPSWIPHLQSFVS